MADPSHPHSAAHFVFAEPSRDELASVPADNWTQYQSINESSTVVRVYMRFLHQNEVIAKPVHGDNQATPGMGPSTPATLLLMLLPLLVTVAVSFQSIAPRFQLWLQTVIWGIAHTPVIPTPPPRLSPQIA